MIRNALFTVTCVCLLSTGSYAQNSGKEKPVEIERKQLLTQRVSCHAPLSNTGFYEFFKDMKNEYEFDNERLRVAELAVEGQCFTSKQVKVTLTGFTHEATRVSFAKFAYAYVFDPSNYTQIKGGLLEDASWDEVDDYINNTK